MCIRDSAKRQWAANRYNKAIAHFNNQLNRYGSDVSDWTNQARAWELGDDADVLDNLLTELTGARDQLESFSLGDVGGMKAYGTAGARRGATYDVPTHITLPQSGGRPDKKLPNPAYDPYRAAGIQYDQYGLPLDLGWSPTGTSYGEAVSYDMPALQELNTGLAQRYTDKLSQAEAMILAQQEKQKTEEKRLQDYFDKVISDANRGDARVGRSELNTDWDAWIDELGETRADVAEFKSPLDFTERMAGATTELDELEALLTGRQADKVAAQDHLRAFESTQGDELDRILRTLRTADLSDYVGFDEDYGAKAQEIRGLLSGYETDLLDQDELAQRFQDEGTDIGQIETLLAALERDKRTEQQSLDDMMADYGLDLDRLDSDLGRGTIYDYSGQEALGDALNSIARQISEADRRSPLTANSEEVLGRITALQTQLDELRGRRATALETEAGQVSDLIGGLPDLELYDETGLNTLDMKLRQEMQDLAQFGGGTDEQMTSLQDALRQVEDRRNELTLKRSAIESDALALLQELRNAEFYGCLLYTSPSPRDGLLSRMPSSA